MHTVIRKGKKGIVKVWSLKEGDYIIKKGKVRKIHGIPYTGLITFSTN